jgi:type IV pilus assembly protein PilN
MRVTINLATRPFADLGPTLKRLRIAMAVFAVLSIGLGFGLHFLHHTAEEVRARDHSLDGAISRISGERQGYQTMMRQPDNAQVLNQSQILNQLFDQKAFSWTLAMEDLETVLPGGVQVTTLEPIRDDKAGRITLKLRVVGPRDKAVELVQNLEHSRHFIRPTIVGESSEANGTPGAVLEPVSATNKVNFDLLAEYNPATLAEPAPAPKKTEDKPKSTKPALAAGATGLPRRPGAYLPPGPGASRPPFTGVSHPQQPQPGGSQPPAVMRQSGQPRYPAVQQPQPAPKPRAGGPQ